MAKSSAAWTELTRAHAAGWLVCSKSSYHFNFTDDSARRSVEEWWDRYIGFLEVKRVWRVQHHTIARIREIALIPAAAFSRPVRP